MTASDAAEAATASTGNAATPGVKSDPRLKIIHRYEYDKTELAAATAQLIAGRQIVVMADGSPNMPGNIRNQAVARLAATIPAAAKNVGRIA